MELKVIVSKLIELKIEIKNIGIITPYNAQKYKLMNLLCQNNIRIESVDGFQGMEKDYIIINQYLWEWLLLNYSGGPEIKLIAEKQESEPGKIIYKREIIKYVIMLIHA